MNSTNLNHEPATTQARALARAYALILSWPEPAEGQVEGECGVNPVEDTASTGSESAAEASEN
jgi:hypothetical protein